MTSHAIVDTVLLTLVMITLYSTPTCPYCHLAREYFTKHNIAFTDNDVAHDEKKREEMIEKSGQMGVPVIDIDGEILVGFNEEALSQRLVR